MSDANDLAVGGEPTTEPTEPPAPAHPDPMSEPTWEETHAEWMRFGAAEKAGLIDPEGKHRNEWVAFYDGRVVDYGPDMVGLQKRVGTRLGVHWARVVVDFIQTTW